MHATPTRRVRQAMGMAIATAIAMAIVTTISMLIAIGASVPSAAAQEPSGISVVSIEDRCVGSTGRVDISLKNNGAVSATATITIDAVVRTLTLEPGDQGTITVTGRNDGLRSIQVDGQGARQVLFRCGGDYRPDDQIESAPTVEFSDWDRDGSATASVTGVQGVSTIEPDEPAECLFGPGSAWSRATAPGSTIQLDMTADAFGAALFVGPAQFVSFGDLTFAACVEPGGTASIDTMLGDTVWIQRSGGLGNAALTATTTSGIAVEVDSECQRGSGIIEIAVTNSTTVDIQVPVTLLAGFSNSEIARVLDIAPGETAATRISGRTDGLYRVAAYGVDRGPSASVSCGQPQAANGDIATATELLFARGGVFVPAQPLDTKFGHQPEELNGPDRDCFSPSVYGSAWYSFVATEQIVQFDGDDDAFVSLWRSDVSNPTTLDQLEPVSCSYADSTEAVRVVPGERYWFAHSGESYRDFLVVTGPPALNDNLDQARTLGASDAVPGLSASLEPTEPDRVGPCPSGESGSLWWTWTADQNDASVLRAVDIGYVSDGNLFEGDGATPQAIAIFTSEVESPAIDQLAAVGCVVDGVEAPALEPGRKYWLAVFPNRANEVAISAGSPLSTAAPTVTCTSMGTAQIDWSISNTSTGDLRVEVVLRAFRDDRPAVKTGTAHAGSTARISISGRQDGLYSWALRGSTFVADSPQTVSVECNDRARPVDVQSSCLSGAGRIDVFVNVGPELAGQQLTVTFAQASTQLVRSVNAVADSPQRITVTGRNNGDWTVTVTDAVDGEAVISSATVPISC